MATAKKATALKKAPDLKKTKETKATGSVEWKNKTLTKIEVSPGYNWVAQLSVCSDGRKFRSVKQVIAKRDGAEHYINGFNFKNEPDGKEIKTLISLMLTVMPRTADLSDVLTAVKKAIKDRA